MPAIKIARNMGWALQQWGMKIRQVTGSPQSSRFLKKFSPYIRKTYLVFTYYDHTQVWWDRTRCYTTLRITGHAATRCAQCDQWWLITPNAWWLGHLWQQPIYEPLLQLDQKQPRLQWYWQWKIEDPWVKALWSVGGVLYTVKADELNWEEGSSGKPNKIIALVAELKSCQVVLHKFGAVLLADRPLSVRQRFLKPGLACAFQLSKVGM